MAGRLSVALTGFLRERFLESPSKPAIVAPAGNCSFGELEELCGHWDVELERRELAPGTVVSVRGDYSPSVAALLVALVERGAVVVPQGAGNEEVEARREEIAQVELRCLVDTVDDVRLERTGRDASHGLYDELRRRDRAGIVAFSSGTSGEPKAAVHDLVPFLEVFHPRRSALSLLAFLRFDHLGGVRTMLHALSNSATMVATSDRSPGAVCELIEEHRVELLPVTPSFLNLLLLSGAHRRHDLGSLRVISYGAEPMPQPTLDRLRADFPWVKLQQTYGLIELGAMSSKSREDGSLWVKVGGEGFQTRVVDGILQVRGRAMTMGYLNAPTPITSDGWFVTGDAVRQEGEYLRFLGRKSELINVGGEKVYPAEVEGVIESVDGVVEATVHGEANGLVGQIVCARVDAEAGVEAVELAREVKRVCRRRLERFKVPVKIEVTPAESLQGRIKKPRPQARGRV